MLTSAPANAFAPHAKTCRFHLAPHEFNDIGFPEPEMLFDRFKAGFIIPSHGNNFRYFDIVVRVHGPSFNALSRFVQCWFCCLKPITLDSVYSACSPWGDR